VIIDEKSIDAVLNGKLAAFERLHGQSFAVSECSGHTLPSEELF
jgi:hypothetical protein